MEAKRSRARKLLKFLKEEMQRAGKPFPVDIHLYVVTSLCKLLWSAVSNEIGWEIPGLDVNPRFFLAVF